MYFITVVVFVLTSLSLQAQNYTISTVAGQGLSLGDGGAATDARFGTIPAVAVGHDGTVYIADAAFNEVRKVTTDGTVSLFAGSSVRGFGGDGGPATSAMLDTPTALAVDSGGSVYIGDSGNHRIRVVSTFGNISTVAGNGQLAPSAAAAPVLPGEGGPATSAPLNLISGIGFATNGDLLITDSGNNRVFQVSHAGNITTLAGNATTPASLSDQRAAPSTLNSPSGIVGDYLNNVYFAETNTGVVRKIDASGTMTVLTGGLMQPVALATDGSLNIYIVESTRISIYMPANAANQTAASIQTIATGSAVNPRSLAIDKRGNLYLADSTATLDFHNRVRVLSGNTFTSFAGGNLPGSGDLYFPRALAVDPASSTVYIADTANSRIRALTPDGKISTFATTPNPPTGLAVDSTGALYIADSTSVSKGGGTVVSGLNQAGSLAIDAQGNLYVDQLAQLSQFAAATQMLSPIAGTGTVGFSGDNGPAAAAQIDTTAGVAVDATGNVYIADGANNRIRKVDATGNITTIAGGGTSVTDGAAATDAALNMPLAVALDGAGNLYIAEYGGNRVRMIDSTGAIHTIAGNGLQGFSGDGGAATNASLNGPTDIKVDAQGNVYIADSLNSAIRKLSPVTQLPTPSISKVSNAGSHVSGPVAPGERVILTGSLLGPNSKVVFDSTAAPVLSSSMTSTMVVVPYEVAGRTTSQVTVSTGGVTSAAFPVQIAASAPGIYAALPDASGQAVAYVSNGTLNSPDNPVNAGDVLAVLCTGAGNLSPAVPTGVLVPPSTPSPVLPVTATLNGETASIDQSYAVPGTIGQFLVDIRIPADVATNSTVTLQITVGAAASQYASIAVLGAPDGGDGGGDGGGGSDGGTGSDSIFNPQLRKHVRRPLPPLR